MSTPEFFEKADCHLSLGSMNAALRAQRALQQAGITATVVKTTNDRRRGGCLYGLALPCIQYEAARRVLREHNIPVSVP